jgi:hypothetical protein
MVVKNDADPPARRSHLFVLRLWPEDVGCGQTDWRGKVQHVNSGEARYYRDWPTLEAFVEGLLRGSEPEGTAADRTEETER